MCSAMNSIDASGLESLKSINQRLTDSGIVFHLSEVKGPIMDSLKKTKFYQEMKERIHLSQYDAVSSINSDSAQQTLGNK
jgi:SulP family sulfate permease